MDTLKALRVFMDYCNKNEGMDERVTQSSFQRGIDEILNSSDDRFADCYSAKDVLRELRLR